MVLIDDREAAMRAIQIARLDGPQAAQVVEVAEPSGDGEVLIDVHAAGVAFPDALQSPNATEGVDNFTPFAFGDFTWLNGSPRNKQPVFDTKFFTPDIRLDVHYMGDFNHPRDHLPRRSLLA